MQSLGIKHVLGHVAFETFHRFESMILFKHLHNLVTKQVYRIR